MNLNILRWFLAFACFANFVISDEHNHIVSKPIRSLATSTKNVVTNLNLVPLLAFPVNGETIISSRICW